MTKRALAIFTAITLVLVVAAFATYEDTGPTGGAEPGEAFFPELGDQLDDVRAIRVTYRGETFTIQRTDDGWGLKERSNYPANEETVVRALREIATLRQFEIKTSNPERYDALQVEDPSGEEADSKLVTLVGADDEVMASIIIGKANTTNQVLGRELVYVRRPDDEQSWLAVGNPSINEEMIAWAQQQVMRIETERMRAYTLTQANGDTLHVSRPSHTSNESWEIRDRPEGREQKSPLVVGGPASALNPVNLRDMRPVGEIDFEANNAGTAEFLTFDGIRVKVRLAEQDEKVWATFEAEFVEDRAWSGEAPEGSKIKSADDARQQAEEINARVQGWAYQTDNTSQRYFQFKMDDILQPAQESQTSRQTQGTTTNRGATSTGQSTSGGNASQSTPANEQRTGQDEE